MELIQFTKKGFYCPPGDFYIDPSRGVPKAIITHGHSDHARRGSKQYICHHHSKNILKHRLGAIKVSSYEYGETFLVNGVSITLFPAGHVFGSAQVKLTYRGITWVITGDYKLDMDPVAANFEPVPCDVLVTESTFGLPIYQWQDPQTVFSDINQWWDQNCRNDVYSIVYAYSLGKAQRIIQSVDNRIGKIYVSKNIDVINQIIRISGTNIRTTVRFAPYEIDNIQSGSLIISPPSSVIDSIKSLGNYSIAGVSGWMASRNNRRTRGINQGFVLSDHADWNGLNQVVRDCNPDRVYVTHGFADVFARWLCENGQDARVVNSKLGNIESELNGS